MVRIRRGTRIPHVAAPLLLRLRLALPHLVAPIAMVAAFHALRVSGTLTLLPVPPALEMEYGNLAVLLGSIAALVATQRFGKDAHDFGLGALLPTALGVVLTLVPYLMLRHGRAVPLSAPHLAVVATVAYLTLYTLLGTLLGGAWTALVKLLRLDRSAHSAAGVDSPFRGRLD